MCSGDGVYQRIASWAHGIGAASIEDSAIEVGFDEHFSQADSFAVVPESTAEPSAWETERGKCFHDHQCNRRLSQGLTTEMQYVVTLAALTREGRA
jgi:hypothetical protein